MTQPTVTNNHKPDLSTGLSIWRGVLNEEYLASIKSWSTAAKIYREMMDDAIIGALLESVRTPLLASEFEVHPASSQREDIAAAAFLETCMNTMRDMEWLEHTEEMLDFLGYGFAISEKVWEKRKDGYIYIKALIPVGQETLDHWGDPDELGEITGFHQRDPVTGKINFASRDRLLHFTFRSRKRNPQGYSILRSLYRPWYFKKNLETIEAIGAERDVGNAPIAELGDAYYSDTDIQALRTALEAFRMDEAAYLITPKGIRITAYGGGNKVYNIREIIRDWQHIIRQRFFADFLSLGSEQVGTQALAREMTTFFSLALRSIQNRMLSVWNRQLVPQLFHYNNWQLRHLPKVSWQQPGAYNIQSLAQAYSMLVGSGLLESDAAVKKQIRHLLGFAPPGVETRGQPDVVTTSPSKES